MKILKKIKQSLKKRGLKETIRRIILKSLNIDRQQEEIDTIFYLLNRVTDITKLEPTKDNELRIMQICNAVLLDIFDKMCKKYHLRYWLDWGTLLGAVRHNGFIPWDDDLDVSMPREDYDRVIPLMMKEMQKYGITVRWGGYYDTKGYMARLAFAYRTLETGVWMDIFPMDYCDSSKTADAIKPDIQKNIDRYQKYYAKYENINSNEQMLIKKSEIFANVNNGTYRIWYHGPEFLSKDYAVVDDDVIFPLKKINFEGYSFNAPANCDAYLRSCYGDTYMEYPHRGVENHRDPDGGMAKKRAEKNHLDMQDIFNYLKSVAEKI